MANITTISNINSIFRDFSDRSYIINTFGWGANYDITSKEVTYPLLWVDPAGSLMAKSDANDRYPTIDYTFTVKFLDLVSKDMSNEVDVESDMLQLGTDLVNEFNDHPYYQRSNMRLIDDIRFTKLQSFTDDQTYGYEAEITIRVTNTNSFCGLPLRNISGFNFTGPEFTAVTYSPQFLKCSTLTACTSFQNYIAQNTSSENIFNTNGSLTGNRIVSGGTNNLSFTNIGLFTISGGYFGVQTSEVEIGSVGGSITLDSGSDLFINASATYFEGQTSWSSGGVSFAQSTGNTISSLIIDWGQANGFDYIVTGNTSVIFTGASNAQTIVVSFTNDSTGGYNLSFSGETIRWAGGSEPTFTTTSGVTDVYTFVKINNNIYGSSIQNMY